MEKVIMWVIAAGALLGGLDKLTGGRFGLGKQFDRGFELWGSTALAMVGIICLTPLISAGLQAVIVPLWHMLGLDPGMLGGVLAIDMGGYQLAVTLADQAKVGAYAGLIIGATLGCTITFTIPIGMGMMQGEDQRLFARGLLIGLIVLSPVLTLAGWLSGLPILTVLVQNIPVFLLSALLVLGLWKKPQAMVKGFSVFAKVIQAVATIGLTLAAIAYMTGWTFLPQMTDIREATAVVSSITVVMLGSLPIAELLRRALDKPFRLLGRKTGLNTTSLTALLIGAVSVMPALAMIRDMDRRGKVVNAACMVCSASALAAHLGFTFAADVSMVPALLFTKLIGGTLGAVAAYFATKGMKETV